MIPRTLHYCWFGSNAMPLLVERCMASWREHLGDFEFVRWDESNLPLNDFTRYHLGQSNWAFVSDYVRLHALHAKGGVYLDTDVEVIRPFDKLLKNKAFVALHAPDSATNAISGSVSGHVFFLDCMAYTLERFESGQRHPLSPEVTTNVYEAGDYDLVVYDCDYFYPYNPYDKSRPLGILMHSMITENTHAIHHWAKSWKKRPKPRRLAQIGRLLANLRKKLT